MYILHKNYVFIMLKKWKSMKNAQLVLKNKCAYARILSIKENK